MTKLTTTQAYNAQVKADRRAAAAERREAGVASDNVRVAALFAKAESPKPAPEVGNVYLLNELDQIQDEEARFTVYIPSNPWESMSADTWAEAQRLLAIKADEFVYAQIRRDGKILDDLQIL